MRLSLSLSFCIMATSLLNLSIYFCFKSAANYLSYSYFCYACSLLELESALELFKLNLFLFEELRRDLADWLPTLLEYTFMGWFVGN